MSGPTEHPVDLSKLGARWAERSDPDRVAIPHGEGELPFDLPVTIEVARVMGDFPGKPELGVGPARGLLGWIVEYQAWTLSTTVRIKLYRDPKGLVVEVDGEEVYRQLRPRETSVKEANEVRYRVESRFIDAADLQSGDEVIEEEDGTVSIKRAEEAKHERRAKRVNKRTTAAKRAKEAPAPEPEEEEDIEWE